MPKSIVVYHSFYGCETGCCGHRIYMGDDAAEVAKNGDDKGEFAWDHPYLHDGLDGDGLDWAKELVVQTYGAEHVADLDWEHCFVTDNC